MTVFDHIKQSLSSSLSLSLSNFLLFSTVRCPFTSIASVLRRREAKMHACFTGYWIILILTALVHATENGGDICSCCHHLPLSAWLILTSSLHIISPPGHTMRIVYFHQRRAVNMRNLQNLINTEPRQTMSLLYALKSLSLLYALEKFCGTHRSYETVNFSVRWSTVSPT